MRATVQPPSALVALATATLVVTALYFGKPILMPLAVAVLLTFLLSPIVNRLQRAIGQTAAVLALVVGVLVLVAAGTYGIGSQISALASELPAYKDNIREKIVTFREAGTGGPWERIQQTIGEVQGELKKSEKPAAAAATNETGVAAPPAEKPVPVVVRSDEQALWQTPSALGPLLELLANIGLIIVLIIFMLLRRRDLRNRVIVLFGYSRMPTTTRALDEAGVRISRYLLMQTTINASYGLAVWIGLAAVGLPYAMLWGFMAAMLRFIPYVGPWLGASMPILLSLAVFPSWFSPLIVLGLFLVLELIANMVLEPLLYGQTVGVSEVALLVAVAFWTWLWGPAGLALATPLTVCVVVLGKYVPGLSFINTLMGDEAPAGAQLLFYQRLLALDEEEAREILVQYKATHDEIAVFDELLLPTLVMTKRDAATGKLPPEEVAQIAKTFQLLLPSLAAKTSGEATSPSEPAKVLLVPTEHRVDELAAELIAAMMPGFSFHKVPVDKLAGEVIEIAEQIRPAMVCVVDVSPGPAAEFRQLAKRFQTRLPELKTVFSRLGMQNPKKIALLMSALGVKAATTFTETRNMLVHVSQLRCEPAPVSRVHDAAEVVPIRN